MINLDGKVAIIPGGATLIGRKVAHEFLGAGARVTVCDIDEAGGRSAGDGPPPTTCGGMLKSVPGLRS